MPGVAAARDVDGGEIERKAEQVVAQRLGHELVDLVARLTGHAAHDGAGGLLRRRSAGGERERVEEGLDQADLARGEIRVEAVDRLGQHRVAEAIDRVRELGDDRRIDRVIEIEERVDLRLDRARELLEHEMLVLHLGAELGRLEQALAVPLQGSDLRRRCREGRGRGARHEPLAQEREVAGLEDDLLGLLHQPVVLGVEDGVDGGQADVLVHAAVARDVVRVEQFVVVEVPAPAYCRRRCRRPRSRS